jgi:tetratricopeptide (TPR) repeat protein
MLEEEVVYKPSILIFIVVLMAGCATHPQRSSGQDDDAGLSNEDSMLVEGMNALSGGHAELAIEQYFDKVIDRCSGVYDNPEQKYFSSRDLAETIFYLGMAAAADQKGTVISQTCAEALYLKGYASLELGKTDDAETYVKRAIGMSPVNANYLSELGHIYHVKKDWKNALETFRKAEEYADTFSPEELKEQELTRAKRGIGYSLIELGELDEAEAKFNECLEINGDDQAALNELKYIEQLRRGSR